MSRAIASPAWCPTPRSSHLDRHSKAVMQDIYAVARVLLGMPQGEPAAPLNGYKWIRAFTAYDEWQNPSSRSAIR
jgi:hypothetical protein